MRCRLTLISLVLIFLCQISGSASSARTSGIVPRLLNAKSTCAAATNAEINFSIYKQCISSTTEDVLPNEVGDFVALQPSIFSRRYANESHFRKTVFEELINPWLTNAELAPGCCRCQENGRGEVLVSSVLGCCSIQKSLLDISFMREDEGALIAYIEGKNKTPSAQEIKQAVAYSVCPLAFCRWGRWRNDEPLVSLIISPQSLHRLTFSKSTSSAFGLELKIETTRNKVQMEYELHKYVHNFIDDFHKAETANFIDHDSVNPLDWTPMNLKMEDLPPFDANSDRWRKPQISKNGFLFRTSSDAVEKLRAKYEVLNFPCLASGIPVIVKYLSAVLNCNYEHSENSLNALMKYSEQKRKFMADLAAAERRHLADLAAAERRRLADLAAAKKASRKRTAKYVERYRRLKKQFPQAILCDHDQESISEAEDETLGTGAGTEQEVESDTQPIMTTMSYAEDVVHPYLGILTLTPEHPMVVMHDAGDSLYDLVYCSNSEYRLEWQRSPEWRAAFLDQVGLSALNLVDNVRLCHNDIRLPNIAVRNGKFSLIDFDISSASIIFQRKSAFSPPLKSANLRSCEREMCYSVAQIAVNVFILSAPTLFSMGEVTAAESIWSEVRNEASQVDTQFQEWVDTKGGLLLDFISIVRAACNPKRGSFPVRRFPADFNRYFVDVLRKMLVE